MAKITHNTEQRARTSCNEQYRNVSESMNVQHTSEKKLPQIAIGWLIFGLIGFVGGFDGCLSDGLFSLLFVI